MALHWHCHHNLPHWLLAGPKIELLAGEEINVPGYGRRFASVSRASMMRLKVHIFDLFHRHFMRLCSEAQLIEMK